MRLIFIICMTTAIISVSCRNVHIYETIDYNPKMIEVLQKNFHSGCISILHSVNDSLDLKEEMFFTNVTKALTFSDTYVTLTHIRTYNHSIECRRNRLLNLVFSRDKQSLHYITEIAKETNARWILFLLCNSSMEELFYGLDTPMNREIFVAQRKEELIHFMEVYRVHPTFPLETQKIGNWSKSDGLQWTSSSFYKRRSNFKGLQLTAAIQKWDALVRINLDGNKTYSVSGYLGDLWSALGRKLNFSTHFLEPGEETGIRTRGSWSGVLGRIVNKEAHVGVTGVSITNLRLSHVDYLVPLLDTRHMLYLRKPHRMKLNWSSIIMPFKWDLWICIIVILFILATSLTLTGCLEHTFGASELQTYQFSNSLFYIFGCFCLQGQDSTPMTWACRIVYIISFLTGVLLLVAYSAELVSFLTVQRPELPFHDLKGLLSDRSYKLTLLRGSVLEYFRNSTDATIKSLYIQKIAAKESSLPTTLNAFKSICQDEKYVFITSSYVTKWLQRRRVINCTIVPLPGTSIRDSISMVLQKRSPYTSILSHSIQEMKYSGQLKRIQDIYLEFDQQNDESDASKFDFKTVAPILNVLGIGILISVLLVFGEMIRHRYARNIKNGVATISRVGSSEHRMFL